MLEDARSTWNGMAFVKLGVSSDVHMTITMSRKLNVNSADLAPTSIQHCPPTSGSSKYEYSSRILREQS